MLNKYLQFSLRFPACQLCSRSYHHKMLSILSLKMFCKKVLGFAWYLTSYELPFWCKLDMSTLAGGFLITNYHNTRQKVSKSNLDQGRKQKRQLFQTAVDAWHGWSLKFSFCNFPFRQNNWEINSIQLLRRAQKSEAASLKPITWVLNWIGRKQRNQCLLTSVVRMQAY